MGGLMTKKMLLLPLLALLVTFVPAAQAEWGASPLDTVASQFATRPVTVVCRTEEEDSALEWAWGYVNWPPYPPYTTYINEYPCLGAVAIDLDLPEVSDGQKVLGLVVLLHEAFHLRPVPGAFDERVTECRAFRNYDKGLRALGAEPEVVDRLMPRAIARHFDFVRRVPEYNLKNCKTPARYDRYVGP
jgi:hypothetical protein